MTIRPQTRRYVLDANALVSLIEGRAIAAERVRHLLQEAVRIDQPVLLSSINWGEVFYIAWRLHGEARALAAEFKLKQLPIEVISVDRDRATRAAALKQR